MQAPPRLLAIGAVVGLRRFRQARGGAAVLTSHIDLTLRDPAPTVLQLDAYRAQ